MLEVLRRAFNREQRVEVHHLLKGKRFDTDNSRIRVGIIDRIEKDYFVIKDEHKGFRSVRMIDLMDIQVL